MILYVSISLGVYYNLVDSVLNSEGGHHLGSPKIQDFDYFWKILRVFMIIYGTIWIVNFHPVSDKIIIKKVMLSLRVKHIIFIFLTAESVKSIFLKTILPKMLITTE